MPCPRSRSTREELVALPRRRRTTVPRAAQGPPRRRGGRDPPPGPGGDDRDAALQHRPPLAGRPTRLAPPLRELHRRGPDPHGRRRPAARARPVRRRRRLRAARHHRGGARGLHQPRLRGPARSRRRRGARRGRGDDPRARSSAPRASSRPSSSCSGSRTTRTTSASVAEGTSRFLKLLEVRPFAFGTTVFLRFRFDSGDAMGMNMVTIACDRAVNDLHRARHRRALHRPLRQLLRRQEAGRASTSRKGAASASTPRSSSKPRSSTTS